MQGMENYQYTYSYYGTRDSAEAAREEEERRREEQKARERREANHWLMVYKEVKRRKKAAWKMYAGLLLTVLASAAAITAAMVFFLLQRDACIKSEKSLVTARTEYCTLRSDNENLEAVIVNSIDVNEVYRIATEEYNMHYPTKGQVICYTVKEKECVTRDEPIPGKTD